VTETSDLSEAGSAVPSPEIHVVDLGLPALTTYVSVLRSTGAALAARLDFTLDEIEDLRIAVDEASALLLSQAVPGSQLQCQFQLRAPELTVSVSVLSEAPKVPARASFAWTVLSALAGKVDATVDEVAGRATISLTKRGEAAAKQ